MDTLNALFDERFSKKLDGGALESAGRLFKRSVKVYVYPTLDAASGRQITVLDPAPTKPAEYLRQFVLGFYYLRALEPSDPALLSIRTADVLKLNPGRASRWMSMVPPSVAERIQAKHLFAQTAAA